jgi:hypothetical protein
MAVFGHAIWNLGASIVISLIAMSLFWRPAWEALIVAGVVGGMPFSVPPLVIAFILFMFGREKEERVVRSYLPIEVELGTLTREEMADVVDPERCKRSILNAEKSGGKAAVQHQRAFNILATQLAYFHYHAVSGERPDLLEIRRAERLRWQMSALRWSLLNPRGPA